MDENTEAAKEGESLLTEATESKTEDKAEAAVQFDPATYKAPEGVELDPEAFKAFGEAAKAQGLTQPQAEAMISLHNELMAKAGTAMTTTWNDLQTKWQGEVRADKEIGGERLTSEVLPTIAKALDQFGGPDVRQAFDMTGAGNNPAIIKLLYGMAKAVTEGGPVKGNPVASQPSQKSMTELFYPSMTETK